MSDVVVRVEGVSKRYRIGGSKEPYKTFRDAIVKTLRAPIDRISARRDAENNTFWALKDVSFEVKQGDVLGIIGRNGAGKSTLLKILSRITEPTTGAIYLKGRVGALLEVGTGFHPELTGRENIYLSGTILGMTRAEVARKFDEIIDFAGVEQFIDTPVKRYSSGMGLRLGFAVAAHLEPEILIVDEVLAVGDADFQKKCLGKMSEVAGQGRTVLFVSHNMAAVQRMCTRAVWLNSGEVVEQGRTDEIVSNYLNHAVQSTTDQFYPDIEHAPGNDRIRVRRMRVIPTEGDPTPLISMITPIQLEFEYWNLRPTLLNLSLHIYTIDGVMAFNTAPVHDVFWMENKHPIGLFKSMCEIPGYLLNSGAYYVSVMFVEDQARAIFNFNEALSFDVAEAAEVRGKSTWFGKWPGVLHPRLEWNTIPQKIDDSEYEGDIVT